MRWGDCLSQDHDAPDAVDDSPQENCLPSEITYGDINFYPEVLQGDSFRLGSSPDFMIADVGQSATVPAILAIFRLFRVA